MIDQGSLGKRLRAWTTLWRKPVALWLLLLGLIVTMLATLVWLVGKYENNAIEEQLESEALHAAAQIRASLSVQVQALGALDPRATPSQWQSTASSFLQTHPAVIRLEQRALDGHLLQSTLSAWANPLPFPKDLAPYIGPQRNVHTLQVCTQATRLTNAAYSSNYFVPLKDGQGFEAMDLCLPLFKNGSLVAFAVVTLSLPELLAHSVKPTLAAQQEISFHEGDGARLAAVGQSRAAMQHSSRVPYRGQALFDLPGNTLLLRVTSWKSSPALIPNLLTALVLLMSAALALVMGLLLRDLRRRTLLQRHLSEALAFRKAMEDSLITGLRARDLTGRITYVNPAFCAMVGFTQQELLSVDAAHLAPYWPPEHAHDYQTRQNLRLSGVVPPREGFESTFVRKDGSLISVLIIEAPLLDAEGLQTGWMSAIVDVTDQRKAQEISRISLDKMQQSARLASLGEMASLISHELNQPLAAIASYAQGGENLLSDITVITDNNGTSHQSPTNPMQREVRQAFTLIAEQAKRAGEVIHSVHGLVKNNTQTREAVNPQSLIDSVYPLMQLLCKPGRVSLICHVEDHLPMVWCDKTMIEQVLLNLTRNAVEACQLANLQAAKVQVLVGLGNKARLGKMARVQFEVSDLGLGVDEAVREKIGTPFFTTKPDGLGLGLSFCRTVIEQHGGQLQHHANQPQGTVFCFQI